MKTKLFILSIIGSLTLLASCKHEDPVEISKEKTVIDAMYKCLDMTHDQIAEQMETLGFHSLVRDTSSNAWKYDAFVDEDIDSSKRVLIEVTSMNGIMTSIGYNVYLTYESDPAAHFSIISDKIATYGYSDWSGYYEDSASVFSHDMAMSFEYTEDAQIAKDRKDLHKHINKECLDNRKTYQYYIEDFVYTHTDNSQWRGVLALDGLVHGKEEGGKDVILIYILNRIE